MTVKSYEQMTPEQQFAYQAGYLAGQAELCHEFLLAADVDETFGVLDIEAKLEALKS